MIKYVDCDIFDMNVDIIGHQVNLYGIMGGGIAREIRERFPDVYEEYRTEENRSIEGFIVVESHGIKSM